MWFRNCVEQVASNFNLARRDICSDQLFKRDIVLNFGIVLVPLLEIPPHWLKTEAFGKLGKSDKNGSFLILSFLSMKGEKVSFLCIGGTLDTSANPDSGFSQMMEKQVMIVAVDDNQHNAYALEWTLDHFSVPQGDSALFKLVIVQAKLLLLLPSAFFFSQTQIWVFLKRKPDSPTSIWSRRIGAHISAKQSEDGGFPSFFFRAKWGP
ncbi:hypothetical protein SLEP1_g53886 [Rubroshorea leprosula]|uniref:Uncharacterized protein n=1 Tax=Rubroshorea leprosula TaxID=152421 RepID=A0AAV5MAN4_9ROSI|nr:hypothetical protein SLEP1_g53886 [Rubroshorea leprosula]